MAENELARDVLVEQARALGLEMSADVTVEDLARQVKDAQDAAQAAQARAFDKAKKVAVKLKRDAFPLDDIKFVAGDVVEVPVAMAKSWIDAGVAERADPLPGE